MDQKALVLGEKDEAKAVELLTGFSEQLGEQLLKDWFSFFGELFVKYRDGFVTTAKPAALAPVCACDTSSLPYQDAWYNRIVQDTGDIYKVPRSAAVSGQKARRWAVIDKKDLRAFN